jgi:hypothetical protein
MEGLDEEDLPLRTVLVGQGSESIPDVQCLLTNDELGHGERGESAVSVSVLLTALHLKWWGRPHRPYLLIWL